MKICKICIQPDSRPGLYFTDDDICGACLWEKEKANIDWDKRYDELIEIAKNVKSNNLKSNYDCVIGVSGGKDSTRQALVARDELGLRCLLVNCEPPNITDIGKKNIENLKNLGFDVFSIRPNPQIIKKLIKFDFYKHLNPVKVTEFCLYASTYIIAEKFDISLIIQGENPGLVLGTRLTGVGSDSNALKADEMHTLSLGWQEYLNEVPNEKDLFLYHYNRKKLETRNTQGIWLNYFIKDWEPSTNADISKKHDASLPQTALAWTLGQTGVAAVIVGATSNRHLEENLQVFDLSLDAEDHNMLAKLIQLSKPLEGDCFDLERDKNGRHGSIMKYNENSNES